MPGSLPKRLFDLVDALQGRGVRTTEALAAELGVSERTVRRDLRRLLELDVPVESTPGRNGGVQLESGALLPSVRFTDDELLALVTGLRAAAVNTDEGLERAANRALVRLETVLSPTVRVRLRALQQALRPAPVEDMRPVAAASEHVIALAEACSAGRRLLISYRGGHGEAVTERQVDPYGLAKLGPWYVVAYCHLRKDLRTFRVDRIRSISPLPEAFEAPLEFDALRHVNDAIAMAPLQGDLVCSAWLAMDIQTASRRLALATVVLQPADDGVRLTVRTDKAGLDWVLYHLLRLRCEVRIEGPEEFRQAAMRMAARLEEMGAPLH
ncbi:MAG: WYL domain-containing protein [Trueperaceae bacterium]